MKVVYKADGSVVDDGLRVARIGNQGQTIEILTDDKQEQYSEVVLAAEETQSAAAADVALKAYPLSTKIFALEIPDGEIVVAPEVYVHPSDDAQVTRDPNDRAGGAGTLNGVAGNFSGDQNTSLPVTFRPWPVLQNVNSAFDMGADGLSQADNPATWQVNGQTPAKIWRRTLPTKTRRSAPTDFINERLHIVYIQMPSTLPNSGTVDVSIPGRGVESVTLSAGNPVIRAPSHYAAVGPQKAYVGQWLGVDASGTALTTDTLLSEGTTWRLIGPSGQVASGTLTLSAPKDQPHRQTENYNRADVYEIDFTGAPTGPHSLEVDGLGQSRSFEITNDWIEPFACDIARFVTHQRSGVALNNLDGRNRFRNGHPNDGLVVYKSSVTLAGTSEGFTFEGETQEESIKLLRAAFSPSDPLSPKAYGGMHDAGDWDRRIQHMDMVYVIGLMLENFASARNVNIQIPESGKVYAGTAADIGDGGDGTTILPDLLHEALYIVSLWRRTLGVDGAVIGGVEYSSDGIVESRSWNPVQRAFEYAPDPWSALLFVKGVGKLALVCPDPALAAKLTAEAELAWTWANANLTQRYLDTGTVVRARVGAAGVLFRLTGNAEAKQVFDRYNAFKRVSGTTPVRRGDVRYESLDYALANGATPDIADAVIDWLDGRHDTFNRLAQDGATISGKYPPGNGWKRFGPCTGWAAQEVAAQYISTGTPISGARDLIAESLWFAMGANPSGYSVVAGWGDHIKDMVHTDLEDHGNVKGQSCYGISGVGLTHWERGKIEGAMYPADLNDWARYARVLPSSAVVPCTEHGMKASHMELLFASFALLEAIS